MLKPTTMEEKFVIPLLVTKEEFKMIKKGVEMYHRDCGHRITCYLKNLNDRQPNVDRLIRQSNEMIAAQELVNKINETEQKYRWVED